MLHVFHRPLARARRYTPISATAPLSNSITPSGRVYPWVVSFFIVFVATQRGPRVTASFTPFRSRTSPEIATFALPTGVSRSPTTTTAILAFRGVVASRDWGVSGGQVVGHGLNELNSVECVDAFFRLFIVFLSFWGRVGFWYRCCTTL